MRVRRQISLALLCAATSLLGCEDAPPAEVDPCADPAALPYIEGAHVSAQAAVAEMAGACSSSQSIFVHGEDLTELRLPHMQWVAKDIEVGWCRPRDRGCVGNPRLSVVEAPRLKRIRSLTIGKPGAPNPALTTVSFPQLEEISEHLVIQAEALEGIEFPALKRVGGRIEIARCVSEGPSCVAMNRLRFIHMPKLEQSSDILIGGEDRSLTSLTSLRMESLAKVRGDLRFRGMPALMALGLPALRRVDGHLELNHVPRLIALSLPTLASVRGQLLLHELGAARIELPTLREVGVHVRLQRSPRVADLRLGMLRSVGGDFEVGDNQNLRMLDLAGLEIVEGSLRVRANPSLDDLAFDRLGMVGRVMQVRSNRSLSDCELQEQLQEQGLPCDCGGNDSRPLCD